MIEHLGEKPERLAAMEVTAYVIVQMAKPGEARRIACVENPLPADTAIAYVAQNPNRWESLFLVLRSEEFAEVAPGAEIPLLPDPVFRDVAAWEALHGRLARAEVTR